MADFLLELFSEEIPARMQEQATQHLQKTLGEALQKEGISFGGIKNFVTPRRLALRIKDIPVSQAASETELKGPKVGAPEAALAGFLKKSGLTQSDLTERDGVYFAVVKKEGRQTSELLKTIIEEMLASFPWPKSMRWGRGDTTWVRPLHSMICIFDDKVVPVSFAGIHAGHMTRGHRFLSPQQMIVAKASEYESMLEKAFVIADREKRKASILAQAESLAAAKGLVLKKDDGLLEEVTGLVEFPVVLAGKIDAKFMDLPKEVLISEMRAHQKYFALENKDGSLSDTFLITSNMKTDDGGKAIIAGNERVLRARLADGRFFWDQDRKKSLDVWAEGLKSVTFHAKLGTIADKVSRIKTLAAQLADYVPKADKKRVERAVELCKADLVTGMVGEFPELQGVMGRYYALDKENAAVADAIRDHYKPQGPSDAVSTDAVAVCVALADKLDTLISMFAIGEKPTGSKDPFALRRAALGVIRIILENNIRLPLKAVFAHVPTKEIALLKAHDKLVKQTEADLHKTHKVGKYLTVNETATADIPEGAVETIVAALYEFFIDRLIVQLKDQGIRHDVIKAVVANGDDDLVRIVARAKAVQEFLGTEDGVNLLAGYKRGVNILNIEEKKDKKIYSGIISSHAKLRSIEEALNKATGAIEAAIHEERFKDAMNILAGLRKHVDEFFENTLINDADKDIREDNLKILAQIRHNFNWIANFALIEG